MLYKGFMVNFERFTNERLASARLWLAVGALLFASSGHDRLDSLAQIKARGHVVMLTVNGASTYYLGAEGETGFEYELGRAFAESLGVPLEVVTLDNPSDLESALISGQGDFIAAGLPTPPKHPKLTTGPVYDTVSPALVYRQGTPKPDNLTVLEGKKLAVLEGKGYEDLLGQLTDDLPELDWTVLPEASIEDLFDQISREEVDYTIADSNLVELNRRYFPAIGIAFELSPQLELAWVIRDVGSQGLKSALDSFFHELLSGQALARIRAHHFESDDGYEPVGTFTFMNQVASRLGDLKPLFMEAASNVALDWELLAAVGYQESHWNPRAVSPTGVRGVMMLTQSTASQLGVSDRQDPAQSILGGARYLRSMLDRLPERIEMPDRLWLALAAYNIGLGHLEDARVITQRQGKNPDRWVDVKAHLPLLTQERWYSQTRFGYARGYEAVNYVSNVRTFYEILLWMTHRDHPLLTQLETPAPTTDTDQTSP